MSDAMSQQERDRIDERVSAEGFGSAAVAQALAVWTVTSRTFPEGMMLYSATFSDAIEAASAEVMTWAPGEERLSVEEVVAVLNAVGVLPDRRKGEAG